MNRPTCVSEPYEVDLIALRDRGRLWNSGPESPPRKLTVSKLKINTNPEAAETLNVSRIPIYHAAV